MYLVQVIHLLGSSSLRRVLVGRGFGKGRRVHNRGMGQSMQYDLYKVSLYGLGKSCIFSGFSPHRGVLVCSDSSPRGFESRYHTRYCLGRGFDVIKSQCIDLCLGLSP